MKSKIFYFLLALMVATVSACSSDDPLVPSITVPTGSENYFGKNIDFQTTASSKDITFNSNMDWNIEVPQNIDWCKVSPTSGNAGTQNVTISVSDNETYDDRSAVLRFCVGDSTKTIIVNQKQLDALTLTADKFEIPQEGGNIDVEVKSNIDFTYVIPEEFASWIHASSRGSRALTSHHLSFSISASEEYEKREGQIIIKSGNKEEVVKIYQGGGGLLTLTSNDISVGSEGGTAEIVVNSNFDFDIEMPNVDWLKKVDASMTRAISSHVVKFMVAENKGYDERSASVKIFDKNSNLSETVKITQSQLNAILVDGEKNYSFDEEGGNFTVTLNSNVKYDIAIDGDWIKESSAAAQTRALSKSTHTFDIAKLPGNEERTGTITFKNETTNTKEVITIVQKPSLFFASSAIEMREGSSEKLKYTNNLADKNVKFSSSNTEVATVSEDGTINAVSRGKTTITVTSADGKHSDKCEITVKNIVDYLDCYCAGGSIVSINGLIRYGSQLNWALNNKSTSDIKLKSLQLVDGATGKAGNEMSIDAVVPAGTGVAYTVTIGLLGIHSPVTCKFKIEYNNKTYTVEAVYE